MLINIDATQPESIRKSVFQQWINELRKSPTPLKTYIELKAAMYILEAVNKDKEFKTKVKENYLELTEGCKGGNLPFDIKITTPSTIKAIQKKNTYAFSASVIDLEAEYLEQRLKADNLYDLLQQMKNVEINNGIAKLLSGTETPPVEESFNIILHFNQ